MNTGNKNNELLSKRVAEALDLVPFATGEVREFDRGAATLEGELGKGSYAAPLCKVIDIHVQRQDVSEPAP